MRGIGAGRGGTGRARLSRARGDSARPAATAAAAAGDIRDACRPVGGAPFDSRVCFARQEADRV